LDEQRLAYRATANVDDDSTPTPLAFELNALSHAHVCGFFKAGNNKGWAGVDR
jgi:hypothetical protein